MWNKSQLEISRCFHFLISTVMFVVHCAVYALCGIFLVWLFSWVLAFVILLLINLICNVSGIPWCSGVLILARNHVYNLNQAIYTFCEQILWSYSSGMKSALFRKCTECKESCRLHRACVGTLAHNEFVTPLWICTKRGGRCLFFCSRVCHLLPCMLGLLSALLSRPQLLARVWLGTWPSTVLPAPHKADTVAS